MRLTNECQVDYALITNELLDLAGLHCALLGDDSQSSYGHILANNLEHQ